MSIFGSSRGAGPSYSRSQRSRANRERRVADLVRYALRLSGGAAAFVMSPTDRTKALHPTGLSQDAASSAAREMARRIDLQGDRPAKGALILPEGIGSASSRGECALICETLCIIGFDADRAGRIACEKAILALARLARRELEYPLNVVQDALSAGLLRPRNAPSLADRPFSRRGLA